MDWINGLQRAIDYIEDNLTETIDYEKVAAQSFSSSCHFQRVFRILCGFTIGEYIRNRRLSLAGTFNSPLCRLRFVEKQFQFTDSLPISSTNSFLTITTCDDNIGS